MRVCLCMYSLHMSVYVCMCVCMYVNSSPDYHLDSRTNPILKEGGDVMKRGRASLLLPLHSHHRWKERRRDRESERERE